MESWIRENRLDLIVGVDERIQSFLAYHAAHESAPRGVCPRCQFEITIFPNEPEHVCNM